MNHNKCRTCRYSYLVDLGENGEMLRACVYIVKTGSRRPCAPGEACTVWAFDEAKRTAQARWAFPM